MPRWVLVAIALYSAPSIAAPTRTAAVIVGDPSSAARFEAVLRSQLERSELATIARVGPASERAATDTAPADRALDHAVDLFYANRVDDALAELAATARALAPPARDNYRLHVKVALWRAAMLERRWTDAGRPTPAPAPLLDAVHAVLHLDPDVPIDLETFWPRFGELVEAERKALPRVTLRVRGVASTADVRLDGRAIGLTAEAVPGPYRLTIATDGFVPSEETIDLTDDVEVVRTLTAAVPPAVATRVADAIAAADQDTLASEARAYASDAVAFVAAEPDYATCAIVRGSELARSPRLAHAELVAWIDARLASATRGGSSRAWSIAAGLGFSSMSSRFRWGSSTIASERSGGGVKAVANLTVRRWFTQVGVDVKRDLTIDHVSSVAVAPIPTAGRAGWTASIDGVIGARFGVLQDRVVVAPLVHVGVRTRRAGSLAFPGAADTLTSAYTAFGVGLGLALEVHPVSWVSMHGEVILDPLAGYLETPSRGGHANPPDLVILTGSVSLALSPAWAIQLGIDYERIEIQHAGTSASSLSPTPTDVRQTDEAAVAWVGARRGL